MKESIKIGNMEIGKNNPVFIVAEMAGTHEGSLDSAQKLINVASKSKADGIKLHMYNPNEYITSTHKIYDVIKKLSFNKDEWKFLFNKAKEKNLKTLAVAADLASLNLAIKLDTDAIFIYPACIDDEDLLKEAALSKKPLLIQTGGATLEEIENAIKTIKNEGNEKIILIHGYQAFPTKLSDIKLNYLKQFKEKFNTLIGIEDHIEGGSEFAKIIPLMALPYGVCTIIKHFNLDRNLKAIDHESALNPPELKKLIENIRELEKSLGPENSIELSEDELKYRDYVKKRIVAKNEIKKGQIIKKENIVFKRAEKGILPYQNNELLGFKAKRNIKKDESIFPEDVENR